MDTTAPATVRIEPRSGWAVFDMKELWRYRDVLILLALRDIKLRYRQTALGVIWVILQPVLAAAIFAIIFGHFAQLPSSGQPYLLHVFSGLLAWNLFASTVQRAGASIVAETRLMTKVYFPRMLVPLAAACSAVVDFCISLLVMIGLLFLHGVTPGVWLALLPLALTLNLMLAVGLGLTVAALNVRYRDFMYALPFLIQVLMYASPVVFGMELVPENWRPWFALNPLVGILEVTRTAFLGPTTHGLAPVWIAMPLSLLILAFGVCVFRRVERTFADTL